MVSLLIGVIYFGQVLDQDGVMNINGALFIFLTNMTFQNVFAVINASSKCILYYYVLKRLKWYVFFVSSAGILRRTANFPEGASKWNVPNGRLLYLQDLGRDPNIHSRSHIVHNHCLSDGGVLPWGWSFLHHRSYRHSSRKCVHVVW